MNNTTPPLSLVEWQNLLEALKTVVSRYGITNVSEAIDYLAKQHQHEESISIFKVL